jgi:pyruvate dehydrogenase E2 component (dihydrolipoamide acetyltransferase)
MTDTQPRMTAQGVKIRETIPLVAMKRMIADHMMVSHQQIPSVTILADFDVGSCLGFKSRLPEADPDGAKITLTHLVIRALALALRRFPLLNATLADGEIQVLDDINIGMAVALPDGNLIVPVIRNADTLSVSRIATMAAHLAAKAAAGKLGLGDVRGGTFTLSNAGGVSGSLWQTPIINHPQCAILSLSRARQAPVVRDGQLAVGWLMGASLSFDHRIVSGLPASEFIEFLAACLSAPDGLDSGA